MEKAKIHKWQIWRQILSDLPTYLYQISSDAAWHTYLSKNLTSYVNAPYEEIRYPNICLCMEIPAIVLTLFGAINTVNITFELLLTPCVYSTDYF